MIELGVALSMLLINLFISKNNLKPSSIYIGINSEKSLIERAKKVIYYECLSNIVSFVYPVIASVSILINLFTGNGFGITNNVLLAILLAFALSLIAILFSKLYTFYRVKKAIKYNKLRKYIGELWCQVIDNN